MVSPFADSPEFQRLLTGNDRVDVARIALEIGRDAYPEIDVDAYVERIEHLTDRARSRFKPGSLVREILGQINWVLFVEEEFRGNQEDYYDPRNSYLNEVLDRGLGIPITLSVVYATMAERLGLAVAGVDLPLHFMLRVDDGDVTHFVDPFYGGAVYDRQGCERKLSVLSERPVTLSEAAVRPCSSQVLISRMLRNLKAIYTRAGDLASLLPIQRRLTALTHATPTSYAIWVFFACRPNGSARQSSRSKLISTSAPAASDASEIKELLNAVRRELSRWN